MAPPTSFAEEYMSEWSVWVLDHGLPDLPETVEVGWSVPVARWVGDSVGAVLHVQWSWSEDHLDDSLVSEVEILARSTTGWEPPDGSGGTGWFAPPLVRPGPQAGRHALVFGLHGYTRALDGSGALWAAIYGVTSAPVASLVVTIDGNNTAYHIESPCGAWIVGYPADPDYSDPEVVISALDERGAEVERVSG